MKHIIIGDIHGCIVELNKLLNQIIINNNDSLYFIGDLIDKGPESVLVVKKIFELSKKHKVILILGNHEEKFLRYLKNKQSHPKATESMTNTSEFKKLSEELSFEEIEFLRNAYLYYSIPNSSFLLVHAGIPEGFPIVKNSSGRPGDYSGKLWQKMRLLTMTRMLNNDGKFLGLNDTSPDMYFWAEKYDGCFGTVLFGHQPFIGQSVKVFPHAIGIDTGCVFGGSLNAFIIEDQLTYQVMQPAEKTYCK